MKFFILLFVISLVSADTDPSFYPAMIAIDAAFGTNYLTTFGNPSIACNCSNNGGIPYPCLWNSGGYGYTCRGFVPNATIASFYATGVATQLPTQIGLLTSLTDLQLSHIPASGNFPVSYLNLVNLQLLVLNDCGLTGPLPTLPSGITILNLGSNRFTGSISSLPSGLTFLDLSVNAFSGNLTFLNPLVNLNYIDLSTNSFSGFLPVTINSFPLTYISLNNNLLSGPVNVSSSYLNLTNCFMLSNLFSPCSSSVCQVSCSTCSLPKPPVSNCVNGVWQITGSLVSNGTLDLGSPIFIDGNVTLTPTSTTNIPAATPGTVYIETTGTITVSGTLNLTLTNGTQVGSTLEIINASQIVGNFTKIALTNVDCLRGTQQSDGMTLSVLLVDSCSSSNSSIRKLIGIVVGSVAGFVLLVLISLFLLFRYGSPECRQRLPCLGDLKDPESFR